jgi:very-short-patch-repair endonuclease
MGSSQALNLGAVDDAAVLLPDLGTMVPMTSDWRALAHAQDGILARRQLTALGFGWHRVESQIAAERWVERTPRVVSTFTGTPTWEQRVWIGVLHAGGEALVGGLTALEGHGLRNWHRDEITVLVRNPLAFEPVDGVVFFRTRRDLGRMRHPRRELPLCRAEPAALLFAAYDRSSRTGQGLLAAAVQQGVTTGADLLDELAVLNPLPRSRTFRVALEDIAGGAQSMAEIDVKRMCRAARLPTPRRQVRRKDAGGRWRFTDCEWLLPDGRTLVLEVDGGFHMEVEHWEDDIARQRRLTSASRCVVRCTARELRDEPDAVADDLVALGLSRLSA